MPISIELLTTQVRNTAPFIFEPAFLASLEKNEQFLDFTKPASSYFEHCLKAHWATVGTFVPTDVDDLIRNDLWRTSDEEILHSQLKTVEEAYEWDYRKVSLRYVVTPLTKNLIDGHHGEWFSVAAGAYGMLRKRGFTELAATWKEKIQAEVARHEKCVLECWKTSSTHDLYRLSYLVAHNLGDLRRVLDEWKVPEEEFPREFEKRNKMFAVIADINTKKMAAENHRHFPLRKPRALRKSRDFLLPTAPFLDSWGKIVATHPEINDLERAEICEELIAGSLKLPETEGYARALAGIIEHTRGGLSKISERLPARWLREIKQGALRVKISKSQTQFEHQWNSRDPFAV